MQFLTILRFAVIVLFLLPIRFSVCHLFLSIPMKKEIILILRISIKEMQSVHSRK